MLSRESIGTIDDANRFTRLKCLQDPQLAFVSIPKVARLHPTEFVPVAFNHHAGDTPPEGCIYGIDAQCILRQMSRRNI
jgi:hypothetical protein